MRVRRVRVPLLRPGDVTLHGDEAHHLGRVLRARPGDPVRAFDGAGAEADGRVQEVTPDAVVLRLEAPAAGAAEARRRVVLAPALLKGDKLTGVVRAATELGVARVAPVHTARGDVPRLSAPKLERLRRVAAEAAKQAGRAAIPAVEAPVALEALAFEGSAWVAHPEAERGAWEAAGAAGPVTLLTGPEGGFTEVEVEGLVARGATAVHFGPRLLRAETAPVAWAATLLLGETA